ncbi:MAG: hypothetical protein ABEK10_04890 [Candidatus Nanosalina sp.]
MEEIETAEKAREKLEEMLEVAPEYGIDHPRHSEITVFDDGDFRVEVRKGRPQGEITESGTEVLDIQKLIYQEDSDEGVLYRKLRQDEPPASKQILEEKEIN